MIGTTDLLTTLSHTDTDTCFANPGNCAVQFVAAPDRAGGSRRVADTFEGVISGAVHRSRLDEVLV